MTRILTLILIFFWTANISYSQDNTTGYGIDFDSRLIELGEITKGDIKEFEFSFRNTGSEDIVILVASACECSTLDWTRKPIKPQEYGKVSVLFDSGKKEDSEPVDVELYLDNIDPVTDANRAEVVTFTFELIE